MPCSCIDTPTDKVCACKNRRTSSRENDDASSAQPLHAEANKQVSRRKACSTTKLREGGETLAFERYSSA